MRVVIQHHQKHSALTNISKNVKTTYMI